MNVLVVYYSRTGNTRQVARTIADKLDAAVEEIRENTDRGGVRGFLKAGRDSVFNKRVETLPCEHSPEEFDFVVVGTPVWAFGPAPAIRQYLESQQTNLSRIALFLTTGGTGIQRTFDAMAEAAGQQPELTLGVREKEIKDATFLEKTTNFCESLRKD